MELIYDYMNSNKKYLVNLQYHGKYSNDEEKIDHKEMKQAIEKSLDFLCDDEQLYCERYDISLGKPYYDIKKITFYINLICKDERWGQPVETSASHRIRNIYFDVSGSRAAFTKKADNIYMFTPLQPLPCRYCPNSEFNIVIDVNETKRMYINKIIVNVEFENNNIQLDNIRRIVEPKVIYEVNNGIAKFVQV